MPTTILFVDDEPNTVNIIKLLVELDQPEWVFHGLYDGPSALDLAATTAFDFIMLDISMPGMDGIELCRRLRELSTNGQVPIVMLTALDTPQRRDQSKNAGANDFWVKPFKPMQIVKDIAGMIKQ
jgi:CheY-like chemotaxis protein